MRQEIYLLRHGVSEASAGHFYNGTADVPLAEEGRAALRERYYPPADVYVSSPLGRAAETLKILYGETAFLPCPELMECSFGEYEGHTYDELKDRPDYRAWILDETGDIAPPGGESRNAHRARVLSGMERLLGQEFRRMAVVCHGGTIVRLMEHWFPNERDFYGWQPQCGEGWRVRLEGGRPVGYEPVDGKRIGYGARIERMDPMGG